jgi:hypothetical protein
MNGMCWAAVGLVVVVGFLYTLALCRAAAEKTTVREDTGEYE